MIEEFQRERNMITPLHFQNINVESNRICKSPPTQVAQKTQDDNDDVELQMNANESQD